jgi:hypothetical protein
LRLLVWIYLVFQLSWGLNYDRSGVARQMGLDVKPYTAKELYTLAGHLKQRLNYSAAAVDTARRQDYLKNRVLFDTTARAYANLGEQYSFLKYPFPSIKSSLFSGIGYYIGFTGYYNPFTGEAQLNNTVPVFLRPFIVSHEIAHQLGYAKENEASFVAYLNCSASSNPEFRYSVYFELYRNALAELGRSPLKDSLGTIKGNLHPLVVKDSKELDAYLEKHRNLIEPFITKIYDRYLRLNNQPKGKATYNEVLLWLIAHLKKNGIGAL